MKKVISLIFSIFMAAVLVFSNSTVVFAAPEDDEIEAEYDEEANAENSEDEEGEEGNEEESSAADADQAGKKEPVSKGWPVAPETRSGSVYMIEANTGAVLYEKDIDTKRYPASTTKILTALVALENCSLTETVKFSKNAVTLEDGASSIDAVEGEEMSMKDCLYGLLLPSGNDCGNAIAEHISGSVEAFMDLMNAKAEELGCESTHFTNPHGLFDPNHYTTASDLMKIARAAFNNSAFCEIISHPTYTISATNKSDPRPVESTHYMKIPGSSYYNETVVGGKTGYLPESGRCLVTLAKHNGLTVIVITLFCADYNGVFLDTQELLDYVFNGFALNNVSESESRFGFANENAKMMLDSSVQILMPSSLTINDLDSEIEFTYDMTFDEFTEASEKAGITTRDGRHLYAIINYSYEGNYLGHINVIQDDNMHVAKAAFVNVEYLNIWYFIAAAVGVLVVTVIISTIITTVKAKKKKKRTTYTGHSRSY